MEIESLNIRKARPEELQNIISIDDESSKLYLKAGLRFAFEDNHPFIAAESARWSDAIDQGLAYVAIDRLKKPIGFITLSIVDNNPYLDQISVHPNSMRLGIGARLLEVAISWSSKRPLWLTTYSHILWNKPYYEKHGFVQISENDCGPQLCSILQEQRLALPEPEKRIVMVRSVR